MGWRLTNNTSGGDGVPDLPAATRAKMAAVWKGRKHKPETAEKMRAYRMGVKHTQETKDKMSRAHKGREITWGDKLSEALCSLTPREVLSIKDELDNGARVIDLADKYNRHRTTISKIKKGKYYASDR